jgi:hypothetical protein
MRFADRNGGADVSTCGKEPGRGRLTGRSVAELVRIFDFGQIASSFRLPSHSAATVSPRIEVRLRVRLHAGQRLFRFAKIRWVDRKKRTSTPIPLWRARPFPPTLHLQNSGSQTGRARSECRSTRRAGAGVFPWRLSFPESKTIRPLPGRDRRDSRASYTGRASRVGWERNN